MQSFPHTYKVDLEQSGPSAGRLSSLSAPPLKSTPPPQFGGPDDQWSPETLFLSSIAQCVFLTFVAIARASKLEFSDYKCSAEGVLDRTPEGTRFTGATLNVSLKADDMDKAWRLLEKAEKNCLVSNSLNFRPKLNLLQ